MKKALCVLLVTFAVFVSFSLCVGAENVSVTIPAYPVTINGQALDNIDNEYPAIVYKDILYIPLSFDMCSFLGLETHFAKYGYNENSPYQFYVGKGEVLSQNLTKYPTKTPNENGKEYSAQIAEYRVYTLNLPYDSEKEEYPLLNFRGVTYFPMTWHFAVELFDWDYKFSGIDGGYTIDTTKSTRPRLDYMRLWNTLPSSGNMSKYVFGKNFYIQYPASTFGTVSDFVYQKYGEAEKRFSITEALYDHNITSVGLQISPTMQNSTDYVDATPIFDGKYFSVMCLNSERKHVIIKIGLDEEKVVYTMLIQ